MQAKEFMLSVQKAEKELKIISAKKRHYADLAMSIGAKIRVVVVDKTDNGSKTETAAIGLYEMQARLDAKEQEYVALVHKAEDLISKIPHEKFRQVLTYRYLCNWSWKSIRDEMGYKDEKSVFRCNGYALRELQKVM